MKMFEGLPCERLDCRLATSGYHSTLLYQGPTFDRHGNAVPMENPNTRWQSVSCAKCGKRWQVCYKGNDAPIWTETKQP